MFIPLLFSVLVLRLESTKAAQTPDATKAACTKRYSGPLITNGFTDAKGHEDTFNPYYINREGFVAYDLEHSHDKVIADFQSCTPNYAQEPNKQDDQLFYGRFYVPSVDKCLAVTDPSGNPPYYVALYPCPSAQDMATSKSIPFNFVSNESGGVVDMRWIGATIPSKKEYQGPNPPAKYCGGNYFVNATNLQHGYNYPYLGEPNANESDDYRVHLYCPFRGDEKGTGYNSFLVPVN